MDTTSLLSWTAKESGIADAVYDTADTTSTDDDSGALVPDESSMKPS